MFNFDYLEKSLGEKSAFLREDKRYLLEGSVMESTASFKRILPLT